MTQTQKFYEWWVNTVKGERIKNDVLESIIIKNREACLKKEYSR